MTVKILDDAKAIAAAAEEHVVAAATEAIAARGRFVIALAGGSTPKALYKRLAARPARVDWDRTWVLFGDERCVPPYHSDSNYRMADEALLASVTARVYRMRGEEEPARAAAAYERDLDEVLRGGAIDLCLLGMGPDGHTASLFPGTSVLDDTHAGAAAVWVPKLDASRLTLTVSLIRASRAILVLAAGADKAQAMHDCIMGPENAVPLQRVVRDHEGATLLVDRACASLLPEATPV